jgi:two-component system, NarL family, sensor histidine kinase DesK
MMTETSRRNAPQGRQSELLPMSERFRDLVPTIAPHLARALVIAVLSAYIVIAAANMLLTGGSWLDVGAAVLYGSALVTIHLNIVLKPREELDRTIRYAALTAEAALVYLPILHLSVSWIGLPGFLAGSLLLLLRPVASIPLASVVLGIAGSYSWSVFHDFYSALYTVVATALTGIVIFGLTRLYQLVDQVHAAQDTFTQLAVAEERSRFSRDVHDLLGLSLSAIMLKTELVSKLVEEQPERARVELEEVMQITRKALAEARQVATGHRELTLSEECDSAASVLTTANVEVSLVREHKGFPGPISSTLATVLREGVTNVLRHSEATWCTITLGSHDGLAELEVVNDGVLSPRAARATNGAGSGLPNLTERVRALGGNLTSTIEKSCRHRLRVTIPLDQPDA